MNDIQKKTYIDKDETDSMEKKTNEKKLCAHTITRQARTTSSIQYYQ